MARRFTPDPLQVDPFTFPTKLRVPPVIYALFIPFIWEMSTEGRSVSDQVIVDYSMTVTRGQPTRLARYTYSGLNEENKVEAQDVTANGVTMPSKYYQIRSEEDRDIPFSGASSLLLPLFPLGNDGGTMTVEPDDGGKFDEGVGVEIQMAGFSFNNVSENQMDLVIYRPGELINDLFWFMYRPPAASNNFTMAADQDPTFIDGRYIYNPFLALGESDKMHGGLDYPTTGQTLDIDGASVDIKSIAVGYNVDQDDDTLNVNFAAMAPNISGFIDNQEVSEFNDTITRNKTVTGEYVLYFVVTEWPES